MRIALLGNLGNTAYNFTKMLRRKGIDADAYVSRSEQAAPAGGPAWEDAEIADQPPSWTYYYGDRNPVSMLQLLAKLRRYDLVHACASSILFSQFAGTPVVAHALGTDMKEMAYYRNLRGYLMRRGFHNASSVLYSDLDHVPHISKLQLEGARYVSAAVDTARYSPGTSSVLPDIDPSALLFFHSSFLSWTGGGITLKRNDRFFKAFARFAQERDDVYVVTIQAGPDAAFAPTLVRDLGIESRVRFVPSMDKASLLEHYRWSDVIVDQFGMPKLGINALEGMSCARPVMVSLDALTVDLCYGDAPPVYACTTEEEILSELRSVGTKEAARQRGQRCRDWILKHHHWDTVTTHLMKVYDEVYRQR